MSARVRRAAPHCINVVCIFEQQNGKMTTHIFFIFESRSENGKLLIYVYKDLKRYPPNYQEPGTSS